MVSEKRVAATVAGSHGGVVMLAGWLILPFDVIISALIERVHCADRTVSMCSICSVVPVQQLQGPARRRLLIHAPQPTRSTRPSSTWQAFPCCRWW